MSRWLAIGSVGWIALGSACSVDRSIEWTPPPDGCRGAPYYYDEPCGEGLECVEDDAARELAVAFLEEAAGTEWGEYLQVTGARFDGPIFTVDVIAEIDWYTASATLIVNVENAADRVDHVRRESRTFIHDLGPIPQLASPDEVLAAGHSCHGRFYFDPCGRFYSWSVGWSERNGDRCESGTQSRVSVDSEEATVTNCEVNEPLSCGGTTGP